MGFQPHPVLKLAGPTAKNKRSRSFLRQPACVPCCHRKKVKDIPKFLFYSFLLVQKGMQKRHLLRRYFSAQRKTGSETSPPRQSVAVPFEAFFAYTSEKGNLNLNYLSGQAITHTEFEKAKFPRSSSPGFPGQALLTATATYKWIFLIPYTIMGFQPHPVLKLAGPTAKNKRSRSFLRQPACVPCCHRKKVHP